MPPMIKTFNEITAYIDGASSGNPGDAAIGVVIKADTDEGEFEEKISRYIGTGTNNFAEYQALLAALERALSLGASVIKVYSDSELLVRQLCGQYRVKSGNLKELYRQAVLLRENFTSFNLYHIRREGNSDADKLAKQALKQRRRADQAAASRDFRRGEESPDSKGQRSG